MDGLSLEIRYMSNEMKISKISKKFNSSCNYMKSGKVISIYDKVVNIMTDKGLFAIQESSIPFTPFTILLADTCNVKALKLEPDDKIYFKNKEITSSKLKCTFENVQVVDTTLNIVSDYKFFKSMINWLIDTLSSLLENIESNENMNGLMDLAVHIHIKDDYITVNNNLPETNLLDYLKGKFHNKDVYSEAFSSEIASLIGLGDGLTPSFDDFLVGLLSCLKFSGNDTDGLKSLYKNLSKTIERNLNSTTSVSAEFLNSALSNEFSEPLLYFYNSINEFDDAKIKQALESIIKIGHSSGIDSINGILFGLKLIY